MSKKIWQHHFFRVILISFSIITLPNIHAEEPAANHSQKSQAGKVDAFWSDPHLAIPLDIPSEDLTRQKTLIESSLKSFELNRAPGSHVQILSDGRYVLYGDLFRTGDVYALVELPIVWSGGRTAFAQLINGVWQLRDLWNIATVWESKEKAEKNEDHFPVKPAEAPFELKDFDGDGVPEVVMAGEIWKYYQYYYLLRFDKKTRSLQILASAMDKPELCDGYVRLYFNSGHRAIFEEWVFAKLSNGKLNQIASWHDGVPYNPGDDEGLRAEVLNRKGKLETLKIDEVPDLLNNRYEITRGGAKIATIIFSRKQINHSGVGIDYYSLEKAGLFSHITGLSPEFLSRRGQCAPLPLFSKYENVKIFGSTDFIQSLSGYELKPSWNSKLR